MEGIGNQSLQVVLKYITFAFRIAIGGLFIYASMHKIADPGAFAISIRNYLILPPAWSNFVALTLPWVELGAGIFLVTGIQTRASALLTTAMLAVFFIVIIRAYSMGLDIDCGCFTPSETSSGSVVIYHIARDGALFLMSLLVLVGDRGEFSVSKINVFRRRLRLLDA